MLLAVNDDGGNLLVHEDQDGDQQGGKSGSQVNPPRVPSEGGHEPAAVGTGWLRRRGGKKSA